MNVIADRYSRRADAFERKVAAVRPERWANESPCEAWTARDVVDHIVGLHGYALRSAGFEPSPAPPVEDDPLRAFQAARADMEAVLQDPERADLECDTGGGRVTVAQHIDRVLSDELLPHAWDLAKATGLDHTLNPEDVERLWSVTTNVPADLMEKYRTPGAFGPGLVVYGPEVVVPEDAPLQDRLLGLLGRNPNWDTPKL